jgi:eukaryotic-like serine/threonine-protein kinase
MAQGPPSREPDPAASVKPGPARVAGETASHGAIDEPADQNPETILGEFRILRRLGKGGMAEVFLAEQMSLKRNVAVKILREERLADETHVRRFKTEATAAAALSHPNIVQVYTIGEQEGTHYIAQEYVQGMNLREYVTRKGPPDAEVALHIMKQVATALQAAHTAGIIHRDIKPENIMLTRRGDVKVADFGLAQLMHSGERVHLTQVGVTMGTPLYMSPEQVNGRKLDVRTDIYSFGVTCYHMLSGAPPFRGETALSVAVQHLKQEAEPLERVRGDLPPALCRIVHKMLAKNPDKRYQTAQEVLKDLKRLTQTEGAVDAAAEEEPAPKADPLPAGTGTFRRLLAGVWRIPDRSLATQVWVLVLLALATGAASAGVGWVLREPDPFVLPAKPDPEPPPVMDSAARQYRHAANLKTSESAWQAVIDFQPPKPIFQNYAREQLALLHLARRRFSEAEVLFKDLAGESEAEFRAFGLAGQAFILHHRGDYQESQKTIERVKLLYAKLDERMKELFDDTVIRNHKAIARKIDEEWQNLLESPHAETGAQRDPE